VITTPDLIDTLASGLQPKPPRYLARRLGIGFGIGAAIASVAMLLLWGPRHDLVAALAAPPLWIKFAFTGLLMLAGLAAAFDLSRPDGRVPRAVWLVIAAVLLAMGLLAVLQLANASPDETGWLLMGGTAASCPLLIMALATPVLAGALLAMRALAPTQLTLAGAAAGLAAGGSAAFIYAFSCDESAMPFVLIWYGLGMAIPTAVGALVGPHLLRW